MKKAISSTERFKKIYDLTMAICKADTEINYRSLVQKKHERWKVLAHIWHTNKKKLSSNIFLNSLGMIFFEYYNPSPNKAINEIIEEVKNAILYDEEALLAWYDTPDFDDAFELLSEKSESLYLHEDYQISQGLLRIFYSKYINGCEDTQRKIDLIATLNNFNFNNCKLVVGGFRMIIRSLLPGSMTWSDQQWCSESYICSEINKKYNSQISYVDDVLSVLYDLVSYTPESEINLSNILPSPHISPELVKDIYKDSTDSIVYEIFCRMKKSCDEEQIKELLEDSWMLKIMIPWAHNKSHPYCQSVRKTVFDIIMQTAVQQ